MRIGTRKDDPALRTQFLRDLSQTIITYNDSPIFRSTRASTFTGAAEHGCSYCYAATPTNIVGFSAGLDFESKIHGEGECARAASARSFPRRKWKAANAAMSGVTIATNPLNAACN